MTDTLVSMLVNVADALDRALVVPHSPHQRAMRAAMDDPQPGDLVIITFARGNADRFGRYLGVEFVVVEEASEDNDNEEITDTAHVIVTPEGNVMRWTNAGVMRVSDLETAARTMLDAARAVQETP